LEPLFHYFEATFLGTVVRQSLWLFPVIECIHLLALALLGGTVLAVDMRLLGLGLRSQPSAELVRKLRPYMVGALITGIVTGVLMFLSEAIKCYFSPPFWYKMGLLLVAILFTFTIRQRVANAEPGRIANGLVRVTAVASLALWFGVGFSGRWIAFY
jgi:hypothetical protein